MFLNTCTECANRQLIFPSQVTSLIHTEHGIVVDYTCWCGAEQNLVTGSRARRTPPAPRERVAA